VWHVLTLFLGTLFGVVGPLVLCISPVLSFEKVEYTDPLIHAFVVFAEDKPDWDATVTECSEEDDV